MSSSREGLGEEEWSGVERKEVRLLLGVKGMKHLPEEQRGWQSFLLAPNAARPATLGQMKRCSLSGANREELGQTCTQVSPGERQSALTCESLIPGTARKTGHRGRRSSEA